MKSSNINRYYQEFALQEIEKYLVGVIKSEKRTKNKNYDLSANMKLTLGASTWLSALSFHSQC